MAYTITRTKSVFGNMRVVHLSVLADAATFNVDTGLNRIIGAGLVPVSLSSNGWHFAINSGAVGTALLGTVGVSGLASGDAFYLTVFGV